MQQTVNNAPTPISPSFAGLLAALTSPAPRTAWNNDDLADDVATLSYEHALRNHTRNKTPDSGEWDMNLDRGAVPAISSEESQDVALPAEVATPLSAFSSGINGVFESNSAMSDRNKKRASITIRLSKEECEQLRRRATQAGLTVSAYMRSCTFEAEALRAQVKDVLAELRMAAVPEKAGLRTATARPWSGWLSRHMPRGHFGHRVASA